MGRKASKYTLTGKRRRQRRRCRTGRSARTHNPKASSSASPNVFHRLPPEVFNMILDKLSVREISVFSMVSKEFTGYVKNYISTLAWKKKVLIHDFHDYTSDEKRTIIATYRDLGLLLKRCSLLLPTKERLQLIYSTFLQIPCFMLEQCEAPNCIGFPCHGVLLQTLIAGWDELECRRVFSFLCDHTNLQQKIMAVVTSEPASKWYQELQLRLFCQHVLLYTDQPDFQFWLMELLKPWPIVTQARLLFILYGPMRRRGTLVLQDLVDMGIHYKALKGLAKAVLLLFDKVQGKGWSTDSVLAILQELTVIPQPWHVENVARLLMLCGNYLCYSVLASKAVNGRLLEVSRLIVHIVLVCEKDGYHMSWVVRLVQQVCRVFRTAPEKFCFIQQLESAFAEITRASFEFLVTGNQIDDGESFQNLHILLDSSARFHTKFLHMFLKDE